MSYTRTLITNFSSLEHNKIITTRVFDIDVKILHSLTAKNSVHNYISFYFV